MGFAILHFLNLFIFLFWLQLLFSLLGTKFTDLFQKILKSNNTYKFNPNEELVPDHLRSKELVNKLALLVKSLDNVDNNDLKFVNIKKFDQGINEDLFTAYRLDFSGRDRLDNFKKKYKNLLL